MARRFYRWRVRCGFAIGGIALAIAQPTKSSLLLGSATILCGQALRLWASGHIEKTRRLASGGPYRHVQHPLYLGSAIIAFGLTVASARPAMIAVSALYALVFFAQAHSEERRFLTTTFGEEYELWSSSVPCFVPRLLPAAPPGTRFSWARVHRNREWKTGVGALAALAVLYVRIEPAPISTSTAAEPHAALSSRPVAVSGDGALFASTRALEEDVQPAASEIDRNADYRLLARAYECFNARDIAGALAGMHPDVEWPNGWEGGTVRGHDQVREYWTRQWEAIDPIVEPLTFTTEDDGRIVVEVRQLVRDRTGQLLSDDVVRHIYRIEEGLVSSMVIQPVG